MKRTFQFIADFEGEIPGQAAKDCGNYLLHDLPMAKYEARKYLDEVLCCIKEENLIYLSPGLNSSFANSGVKEVKEYRSPR